jgi:hypothetical protein
MQQFKVTLLVPVSKVVLAADIKEAVSEAARLATLHNKDSTKLRTIIRSVVLEDPEPPPIDFGFDGDAA